MKQPTLFGKISLLGIVITSFSLLSPVTQASELPSVNQQEANETRLTREAFPQNILEILEQDFPDLNVSVGVPLGTDYPIQFGDLSNGEALAGSSDYIAINYINNAGQPQPITPNDIANLAKEYANRGGFLSHQNSDDEGTLTQGRRGPVIDLVVYNKRNRRYSLVPNVNINAFCRDAFNAVFNYTLVPLNDSSITSEEDQLDD